MSDRTAGRVPGVGAGRYGSLSAVRRGVLSVAAGLGAAALLSGCGEVVASEPVGPGVSVRTRSAEPCPVLDPGTPRTVPTLIDGTPANTPEAARLSQAIGAQGDGAFADVYSTQITDHPAGRVALCVTDPVRGRLLVEAAHAADPGADPARADLYVSPYSRRTLDAAADRIVGLETEFPVHSVSGGNGSSVEVTTSLEGTQSAEFKARLERAAGGVADVVRRGEHATPLLGDKTQSPAP
ncbi:hypothetical protein ACWGDE_36225 [Streptomyces sp. NPDC054956]